MSARARASRAEHKVAELTTEMARQDQAIMRASQWISDMLNEHHPDISGRIDLSICGNNNLRSQFAEKLGNGLVCRACRSAWPCKTLQNIRQLKDLLRGDEYTGLSCKSENRSGIELYL